MSSWFGVSVAIPLGVGIFTSFEALRSRASGWHTRLRKPQYNPPHASLLPLLAFVYTLEGMATFLVSNEMVLAQHTSDELLAVRSGHLALRFYWLHWSLLAIWPVLLAYGPSLNLAMADLCLSVVWLFASMIECFRLSTGGGLLMLLCLFVILPLAVWNGALIQIRRSTLPRHSTY